MKVAIVLHEVDRTLCRASRELDGGRVFSTDLGDRQPKPLQVVSVASGISASMQFCSSVRVGAVGWWSALLVRVCFQGTLASWLGEGGRGKKEGGGGYRERGGGVRAGSRVAA